MGELANDRRQESVVIVLMKKKEKRRISISGGREQEVLPCLE